MALVRRGNSMAGVCGVDGACRTRIVPSGCHRDRGAQVLFWLDDFPLSALGGFARQANARRELRKLLHQELCELVLHTLAVAVPLQERVKENQRFCLCIPLRSLAS